MKYYGIFMRGRVNRVIPSIAVLTVFFGLSLPSFAQNNVVIDSLAKFGFEELRYAEDSSRVVYTLENNVYRLQASGIKEALTIIKNNGGIDSSKECVLILTDMNVPKVAVTLEAGKGESELMIQDWSVSNSGYDKAWNLVRDAARTNRSFGDVDINVYPQLYLKNVIINQIYQCLLEISPAVEVTLWKGAKFTGQIIFPVINDGYKNEYMNIRPGYITLQQAFRLPFNAWGDVRVGVFDTRSYGAEVNVSVPIDGKHWTVNGKFAYLGCGVFESFSHFYYNGQYTPTWSVGPDYYWSRFNVQCRLRVEQYLGKEVGVRADAFRHFKYCAVGLYFQKAFTSAIAGNGGFRIYVTLPPYKYKRYRKAPRVDTGLSTGMTYNGNNEFEHYFYPVTLADDTPTKQNQYNASYIKSYLK